LADKYCGVLRDLCNVQILLNDMNKEKLYGGIKKTMYRKFNKLEMVERNDGDTLYLGYKNDEYAEIVIDKKSGEVYYHFEYKNKICNMIGVNQVDFEVLLGRWIEDTFKIKVEHIGIDYYRRSCPELKIRIK